MKKTTPAPTKSIATEKQRTKYFHPVKMEGKEPSEHVDNSLYLVVYPSQCQYHHKIKFQRCPHEHHLLIRSFLLQIFIFLSKALDKTADIKISPFIQLFSSKFSIPSIPF
ncbi:hypothetical protein V8G54_025430 [Vigna mungo]|uniref:Uncharacterized protein n=1 Tax=Vigna mungo TaxID=3915 RepID=A0AAQ3MZ58_VIGMU